MESSQAHMQSFKEQLFDQFGKIGKALSSPRRLELLDLLCQSELSVEDLCRQTGLSPSSVSQHLKVLKDARLLESRQSGLHHFYSLADPSVLEFWRGFRQLAVSRLPEVREVLRSYLQKEKMESIDQSELETRMAAGKVVLLDVRSEAEFHSSHLPGAKSLPLVDLVRRLDELPRDVDLVAYCRGPFCLMAREATRLLKESGFRARSLEEGPVEWTESGRTLETG